MKCGSFCINQPTFEFSGFLKSARPVKHRPQESRARIARKPNVATVEETLQAALAHHQAGRLAEAEDLYRQILAVAPNHADAQHLLGLVRINRAAVRWQSR